MCLLITAEDRFPSEELLNLAEEQNGHGGGIAYCQDGKVHWVKGIKAKDMGVFAQTGPPWLIHFRIATHGGVQPGLCHPFPITNQAELTTEGTADSVLGHNGTWFGWNRAVLNNLSREFPLPQGAWSDTRAMAFLASIHGEQILDIIDEKVAILRGDGTIRRFGGPWHDGHKEFGLYMTYNPFIRGNCYRTSTTAGTSNYSRLQNSSSTGDYGFQAGYSYKKDRDTEPLIPVRADYYKK